ncbi:hypothetical protein KBC04_04810 [Candidatus Babeliales bacterium]|nr:hypothetical protein [Candidatus Babeliales bacterium]MBP9844347.1 hypothetical protein [Candidatus Babeliales bacterium]
MKFLVFSLLLMNFCFLQASLLKEIEFKKRKKQDYLYVRHAYRDAENAYNEAVFDRNASIEDCLILYRKKIRLKNFKEAMKKSL